MKVRKLLMVSPFKKINSDFISIMNGDDEGMILKLSACRKKYWEKKDTYFDCMLAGIFAWTTLNFLTGR